MTTHNNRVVLVVEDEDSLREMVQGILEDFCGVQTIPAANGLDAVRLAREALPALILMDIMLPEMNGLEAARCLRADLATRSIPIIAVTASVSTEEALGVCDDFIAKPFDLDFFLSKIQEYLAGEMAVAGC